MVMGLLTALDIVKNDPSYRDRLWRNINFFRTSIKNIGFNIGNSQTAVIPILIKDEVKAYKMALMLEEAGIYADAVFYPAVRKGESRIRLMINASHTIEELEKAVQVFKDCGEALNLLN
jgi:glycine C-acetyltransferase